MFIVTKELRPCQSCFGLITTKRLLRHCHRRNCPSDKFLSREVSRYVTGVLTPASFWPLYHFSAVFFTVFIFLFKISRDLKRASSCATAVYFFTVTHESVPSWDCFYFSKIVLVCIFVFRFESSK